MNLAQKFPLERSERVLLSGQLTPRERQVAEMLFQGFANKNMARQLGISTKTVEAHRAQLMRKMQADSFAELVRLLA